MVHLNDCRSELGSQGTATSTWAPAGSAARASHVLNHPALGHVAFLLETPGHGRWL